MSDDPSFQESSTPPPTPRGVALRELGLLFLRLGATAFGGPAAHIAMMEDEVVARRKWLTREQFVDLLGATNLIPGPNSTEMAIHVGYRRAGLPGLIVAGASFILPAVLLSAALAHFYVVYGSLPQAVGLLYGVKPVIIAVVVQAMWRLTRSVVTGPLLVAVTVLSIAGVLAGLHELLVLLLAALAVPIVRATPGVPAAGAMMMTPLGLAGSTVGGAGIAVPVSWMGVFLFFLKVGSVLFGSGYVLLAFLQSDLVDRWGWLTQGQLLDAVAVGQITPGPVFTTATFIGYLLAGPGGAAAATIGIFLPAFFFVAISGPFIPRLRRSRVAGAVLDGLNAASLALMAVVSFQLSVGAIVDAPTLLLALVSAVLVFRFRINSAWLVLIGGLTGFGLSFLGVGPV